MAHHRRRGLSRRPLPRAIPIVPGVIQLEALAQTGGIAILSDAALRRLAAAVRRGRGGAVPAGREARRRARAPGRDGAAQRTRRMGPGSGDGRRRRLLPRPPAVRDRLNACVGRSRSVAGSGRDRFARYQGRVGHASVTSSACGCGPALAAARVLDAELAQRLELGGAEVGERCSSVGARRSRFVVIVEIGIDAEEQPGLDLPVEAGLGPARGARARARSRANPLPRRRR